jgi:hypothetical protein
MALHPVRRLYSVFSLMHRNHRGERRTLRKSQPMSPTMKAQVLNEAPQTQLHYNFDEIVRRLQHGEEVKGAELACLADGELAVCLTLNDGHKQYLTKQKGSLDG